MKIIKLQTILMHQDEYERHRFCAVYLSPLSPQKLLDVGGTRLLKRFFTDEQVVSLNVDETGDITYEGNKIPFGDRSFDAVVSLDTLEHIPRNDRERFIRECIRVAEKGVVIAAPYGSPDHRQNEIELFQYMEQAGRSDRWLGEHIQHGLPAPDEVTDYRKLFDQDQWVVEIYYAGNYAWQSRNLHLTVRLSQLGLPVRLANLISFVLGLRIWRKCEFSLHPSATTNRFYLLGTRKPVSDPDLGYALGSSRG